MIILLQLLRRLCDDAHRFRLRASDIDIALGKIVRRLYLLLGPVREHHDLLGAPAEERALVCQRYFPLTPYQQLSPQLRLELRELPRQRRLGNAQHPGGLCDVLFLRDGQKISKKPEFHDDPAFKFFLDYRNGNHALQAFYMIINKYLLLFSG
ncbi:hypothetical protein SDC9_182507 [bioreactor metagenome]|uniref:Uncharacterized protein n=1 Tax=bioreactor metagenome TaxID=1076179 RepID=A0A645HH64_9ZZZZ